MPVQLPSGEALKTPPAPRLFPGPFVASDPPQVSPQGDDIGARTTAEVYMQQRGKPFTHSVLVCVVCSFLSFSALAATGVHTVVFAMNSWIGYAPLFVASRNGYFGHYRLKYVHMESGINAALIAGDVSIADLSMNQLILDHKHHKDVQVFMPIDYSDGADAIISSDKIRSIKGLRGQPIPLNTSSYSELLLSYALGRSGMSLRDVHTVNMPASDVPSAVLSRSASAGVTWSPHTEVLMSHPGYHILYSSRQAPGLVSDSLCAQHNWITGHQGAVTAIIRGTLKGRAYIAAHPRAAFKIVAHYLGISAAAAQKEYRGVINPGPAVMRTMMLSRSAQGSIITYDQSIRMVTRLMKETGKLPRRDTVRPATLLDSRYVRIVTRGPQR